MSDNIVMREFSTAPKDGSVFTAVYKVFDDCADTDWRGIDCQWVGSDFNTMTYGKEFPIDCLIDGKFVMPIYWIEK